MSESVRDTRNEHCDDLLPFYVARALPTEQMQAIKRHLDECAQCQRAAQEWRLLDEAVRAEAQARSQRLPQLVIPAARGEQADPPPAEDAADAEGRTSWLRRTQAAWPTAVVALLFIVFVAPAGLFRAAAAGMEGWVERLALGRHTVVQYVEPARMAQMTPTLVATPASALTVQRLDEALLIRTPQGTLTREPFSEGRAEAVQRFHSFEETRRAVSFRLLQPVRLPNGYALAEALVTPLGRVFLFYDGPNGAITLMQMPVERQRDAADGVYADVELLTDQPIHAFVMGGYQAAWVGRRTLMWERDGINLILEGDGLARDEATRIALSLR